MAEVFSTLLWVYGGIGGVVALAFLVYGMDRIDKAANGAYAVRPLLVPGLVILWPIVLVRWITLVRNKEEKP